ncbi:MAG: hypothetical protein KF878_27525 [Planctomycetes bacterium]|nr:hypothetical protein [Planctomycetota bacterium]
MAPPRLALVFLVALLAGCGATPRWHAGVLLDDPDDAPRGAARPAEEVEVYFKPSLGAFDEKRAERRFNCGSTTLLRTAFLLEDAPAPPPDRDWEVVGLVTTEEFPRDDATSELKGDEVTNVFGIGRDVHDTYEVRLDPAFREAALERLRWWAARVGADAVVDVYATGEVEHHMWHGTVISFNVQSPHSPIYSGVRLLDLRLRDVRLHGTAVRYER